MPGRRSGHGRAPTCTSALVGARFRLLPLLVDPSAAAACDAPPMGIYDRRHAAATTWLRAGVPLGDVAKRMGHSVETPRHVIEPPEVIPEGPDL